MTRTARSSAPLAALLCLTVAGAQTAATSPADTLMPGGPSSVGSTSAQAPAAAPSDGSDAASADSARLQVPKPADSLAAAAPADSLRPAVPAPEPAYSQPSRDSAAKPIVLRGRAPAGSAVSVAGIPAAVDTAGRWEAVVPVDSATRMSGLLRLCLAVGADSACQPVRLAGYDTLELAPLAMKVDTMVVTRDTIVTDTVTISASTDSARGPSVVVDGKKLMVGQAVTVRAKRVPRRVIRTEKVTVQTIKRLPGLAEPDVIRAVQALPGVVATSDFSNKLYVRGSSSDQNLVLFDNAVVYSPSHFGGLFSSFLADATGGLEFYKGGFEPRYGNRLSSVLLVTSKDGGATADSGRPGDTWLTGAARMTTFSEMLEVDGRKKEFSWVAAGRRTHIGWVLDKLNDVGATDFKLDYDFWDVQGNVAWGRQGDTVRVSLYTGRDSLVLKPAAVGWGNLAVPVNVRKRLGKSLVYNGNFAYSEFNQVVDFSDILSAYNAVETWNIRQELQADLPAGHLVTGGYEFNNFDVSFEQNFKIFQQKTADNPEEKLHAAYVQDRWAITPAHVVTAGLRAYYSPAIEGFAFDPRATYTWRPDSLWRYDVHLGYYHQYLTSLRWGDQDALFTNEYWYPVTGDMKPTTSTLAAAGVERIRWTPFDLRASAEFYYKNLDDVPVFFPNATSSEEKRDSGNGGIWNDFEYLHGYAMGAEFAVNRDEGPITGSVSYGISSAVLKQYDYANAIQSATFEPYYADWDQRHTFKATLNLNWRGDGKNSFWLAKKKGRYFRSSVQATYASGQPYTAYEDYYSVHEPMQPDPETGGRNSYLDGNTYLRKSERNAERKPAYFRVDVTPVDVGYTGVWRFYWTVINLTDHENVYAISYDTDKNPPEKTTTTQFPFLPLFVGVEYEF